MSHLGFALFAAVMLSLAMGAVEQRSFRERAVVAAGVFVRCVVFTVAGSWLMLAIHG